jgi:uncharacterized membrane protein YkgB
MDRFNSLFELAARLDRAGIILTRIGLVVVLVWVGAPLCTRLTFRLSTSEGIGYVERT